MPDRPPPNCQLVLSAHLLQTLTGSCCRVHKWRACGVTERTQRRDRSGRAVTTGQALARGTRQESGRRVCRSCHTTLMGGLGQAVLELWWHPGTPGGQWVLEEVYRTHSSSSHPWGSTGRGTHSLVPPSWGRGAGSSVGRQTIRP